MIINRSLDALHLNSHCQAVELLIHLRIQQIDTQSAAQHWGVGANAGGHNS